MKKECKILLSLIYIILLSVVSFFNASEIIKEILNNNQILIFILDILINTFIFILNIVIMGFIYRVVYKIDFDKISDSDLTRFNVDRNFDNIRTSYEDLGYTCK